MIVRSLSRKYKVTVARPYVHSVVSALASEPRVLPLLHQARDSCGCRWPIHLGSHYSLLLFHIVGIVGPVPE